MMIKKDMSITDRSSGSSNNKKIGEHIIVDP